MKAISYYFSLFCFLKTYISDLVGLWNADLLDLCGWEGSLMVEG